MWVAADRDYGAQGLQKVKPTCAESQARHAKLTARVLVLPVDLEPFDDVGPSIADQDCGAR